MSQIFTQLEVLLKSIHGSGDTPSTTISRAHSFGKELPFKFSSGRAAHAHARDRSMNSPDNTEGRPLNARHLISY